MSAERAALSVYRCTNLWSHSVNLRRPLEQVRLQLRLARVACHREVIHLHSAATLPQVFLDPLK